MREYQHPRRCWIILALAGCLSHLLLYGQTASSKRGVVDAGSRVASGAQPGPYYALVIGNKNYRYLPSLETPISDANAIAKLLRDSFGFQTKVLLDADRSQIMTALVEYRASLPPNSNLLIYYAGHGHHDRDTDEAYWLPVDAQANNNTNWVSADDVTRDVRAMQSVQHVLVISDSCYSGYMTRDRDLHAAIEPSSRDAYLAKMVNSKSRNLMSSGGDEPVADSGAPGHSIFAWAVLQSLHQMGDQEFTAADVFYNFIQPRVGGKSDQLPQYSWIRNSGHDAGDFVFLRQPVAKTGMAAAPVIDAGRVVPAPGASRTPSPANAAALPAGMDPTLADLYHRAEAGNAQAMLDLGLDYYDGKGVPKDDKQALLWSRQAAEAGSPLGMARVGWMYDQGYGAEKDYKQAFSWYRKAAEAGNAPGMTGLGWMYKEGLGVAQDYKQAVYWSRRAAEAGDVQGMINLGLMYQNGWGVTKDNRQALSWIRKGAEAGSANAMNSLGFMYHNALGVEKDDQQAFNWYRKAAEAGDAEGMRGLGLMYEQGYGVEKDYQQALLWFRKAGEAGSPQGMTSVGFMYEHGYGVGQDYQQARSWYRKGAEAGDAIGMLNLGLLYEGGLGVEKDRQQAVAWYRKAAQLGDQNAEDALKRLGESQ